MEQFGVNLLPPDTSIYNVFKNQSKYIVATEKLTPEVEDKVREQRMRISSEEMVEQVNLVKDQLGVSSGQANMESNPSVHIDLLMGYHNVTQNNPEIMAEYAVAVHEALTDENGRDIIDRVVGLEPAEFDGKDHNFGIGIYFDGENVQESVGQQNLYKLHMNEDGTLSAEDEAKLILSAKLHGIFLRQDSVSLNFLRVYTKTN